MPGRINGFSLAYTAVGGVVLWSGIKGEHDLGDVPGVAVGPGPVVGHGEIATAADTSSSSSGSSGSSSSGDAAAAAAVSGQGGTPAANKALGQLMAGPYGWTGDEWLCLDPAWQEESGWNQFALRPARQLDAAYGIPQANPGIQDGAGRRRLEDEPQDTDQLGPVLHQGHLRLTVAGPRWSPSGPTAGYVGY